MVFEVAADAGVGRGLAHDDVLVDELVATGNDRDVGDAQGARLRDAGQVFLARFDGRFVVVLEDLLVIDAVELHAAVPAGGLSMVQHAYLLFLVGKDQLTAAEGQIKRQVEVGADLKASPIHDMWLTLIFKRHLQILRN